MKKIKVCYTERDNLGDSLNPLIFKNVLDCDFIRTDEYQCDMTGIGSGLRRFFMEPGNWSSKKKIFKALFHRKKLYLFSAGFLTTPKGTEIPLRRNVEVISVRGELSRLKLCEILHRNVLCGTGDAGLLASKLLGDEIIEKKHDVGIIPHDKERDEQFYNILRDKIPNSTIIDVRGDVMARLREIASCRTIISSSLHGLIIADSFFIPNLHVKLTNKLSGDGFKFKDYYSAFDMNDFCIDLNKNNDLSMAFICSNYKLSKEKIERKKEEIFSDFKKIKERL